MRKHSAIDPDKTLEMVRAEAVDDVDVLESYAIDDPRAHANVNAKSDAAYSVAPFAVDMADVDRRPVPEPHESTTIIHELEAMARRRQFVPIVSAVVGLAAVILVAGIVRRHSDADVLPARAIAVPSLAAAPPVAAADPIVRSSSIPLPEIPPPVAVESSSSDVPVVALESLPHAASNVATSTHRHSHVMSSSASSDKGTGRIVSPGKNTVIVDGARVASPATVSCGKHAVKPMTMGAHVRTVDVPCGGQIAVR